MRRPPCCRRTRQCCRRIRKVETGSYLLVVSETLLVCGGAGFIGSNFTASALADGSCRDSRVVVFDKLTYAGSLLNLEAVEDDPRYRFVQGDIADRDAVGRVFAEHRPSAVVNFAAESHVDRSIDRPGDFIRTNIVGTFELLEAARNALSGGSEEERAAFRFIHVSTDEVFGSLGDQGRFHEQTPYDPSSPYSASKAAADHLVRAYWRTYGLPAIVTNCSNNYGPYQYPEKLIPVMILNAVEGLPLPIYGEGRNVRDWLHVDDHCAGLLSVLRRGEPGQSYNLGGDEERTNLEVVEAVCAAVEAEFPAERNAALAARGIGSYRELMTFVEDRPGHDHRYAIDASKVRRELDWRPRHDFETGLRETVRWYLDHREWCEAVALGASRTRMGTQARLTAVT